MAEVSGWKHTRTNGDHFVYKRSGVRLNLSIPDHNPVAEGTLRQLLKVMGLTVDEFLGLAKK